MTAPAINPATTTLPGLAGGGAGQAAASGPLAGFEALLAALFGNADIAGVPNLQAAAPETAPFAPAKLVLGPDAAAPDAAPELEEDPEAAPASGEALLNPLLLAQQAATAATTPATTPAAETVPAEAAAPALAAAGQAPPAPASTDTQAAAPGAFAEPQPGPMDKAPVAAETARTAATPQAPAAPVQTTRAEPGAQRPAAPPAAVTAAPDAAVDAVAETPEPAPAAAPAEILAQPAARDAITRAADAPPAAPASRKDKKAAATDAGKAGEEPKAEAPAARSAAAGAAPAAGGARTETAAKAPRIEAAEPEARRMDPPEALEQAAVASDSRSTGQAAAGAATGGPATRGAPETVANLAAQIVKKLEGRSTRFDVELDPVGLGKVDVRVEIGAHGRVTAAMSFDNPQAAAELKSRAGELQKALEQAGFDLSGGMSFDVAGERGQGRQDWGQEQGGAFRGRAFQQALETAGEADLAATSGELRLRRGVTGGVDVRI